MAKKIYVIIVSVEEHDQETKEGEKIFEEVLAGSFKDRAEAMQCARDILD